MSQFNGNKNLHDVQEKTKRENKLKFPYEIKFVEKETNEELMKYFAGEKTGFIKVGPKEWFFPSGYLKEAENLYNFKVRPDDVFVTTFPRSGTTWTQEMVWMLSNDLDYQKSAETLLFVRFPFLEYNIILHEEKKNEIIREIQNEPEKYELLDNLDEPIWPTLDKLKEKRFIKSHLPFSLLPPDLLKVGCKVVYVARNPKDVAVSFYHLSRSMKQFDYLGDFPRYYDYFIRNLVPWSSYWEHIKEGWNRRHEKNVLFLFYEDLNKNLRKEIEKVSDFLGKSYTKEQLDKLENHLKIKNFKNNKSLNHDIFGKFGLLKKDAAPFIRRGKTGGWRDYFDEEMERRADAWIQENMKDTDIVFPI